MGFGARNCPKDSCWPQCVLKRVARRHMPMSIAKIIDVIRSVLDGHEQSCAIKKSQSGLSHLPRDEHIVAVLVWPCISSGLCMHCSQNQLSLSTWTVSCGTDSVVTPGGKATLTFGRPAGLQEASWPPGKKSASFPLCIGSHPARRDA